MSYNRGNDDRRKRLRYYLQKGAYAAFSPHYIKLGPVVNIGLGGFGCHYFIDRDQEYDQDESFVSLRNNKFIVRDIPFHISSDYEIACEDSYYLKMMYCGVKFGQLTFEQFRKLDDFIIYNTVDIATDRRAALQRRSKGNHKNKISEDTFSHPQMNFDRRISRGKDRRNLSPIN